MWLLYRFMNDLSIVIYCIHAFIIYSIYYYTALLLIDISTDDFLLNYILTARRYQLRVGCVLLKSRTVSSSLPHSKNFCSPKKFTYKIMQIGNFIKSISLAPVLWYLFSITRSRCVLSMSSQFWLPLCFSIKTGSRSQDGWMFGACE